MTIPGGYILQPRKIDESEVFKMPPVARELWLYILRKVNHKDNEKYKRGQGFFCLNDVQNDLSWYVGFRKEQYSKPRLTKALRRLNEGNMTETMKATRGLIITVCNYEYYQEPKNYESNGEGSTKVTRSDLGGHTKNKNVKNERKNKVFIPPTLNEFEKYFLENDFTVEYARHVFKYYNDADWVDGKGNQVLNWKQKVRGVWFKDEHKKPKQPKKIVITQEHKDMLNL